MHLSVIWIYVGFSSNVLSEITIPLNMDEASLRDLELVVCEEDITDHNDHTYDDNCGRSDATGHRNFKRKDRSALSVAEQHRLDAEAQRKSTDRARASLFKQTQKVNAIPGYQCATVIYCKEKNRYYVGGDNDLVAKMIEGKVIIPTNAVTRTKVVDTHPIIKRAHKLTPSPSGRTSPVIPVLTQGQFMPELVQDLSPEKSFPIPKPQRNTKRTMLSLGE